MSRKFIIREKIIVFNGGGKTVMTSEKVHPKYLLFSMCRVRVSSENTNCDLFFWMYINRTSHSFRYLYTLKKLRHK